MAVDHQASKLKEAACFCPDTQSVLAELAEDAHAYVRTGFNDTHPLMYYTR